MLNEIKFEVGDRVRVKRMRVTGFFHEPSEFWERGEVISAEGEMVGVSFGQTREILPKGKVYRDD